MAAGSKAVLACGLRGGLHVERTALLGEIDVELARAGVVVLRGPWGYGRTTLLGDYARAARARSPRLPVVRVDFADFEAQAFLNGERGLLEQRLAREARARTSRGAGRESGDGVAGRDCDGADGEPRATSPRGRSRSGAGFNRPLPACFNRPATRLVYESMAAVSPAWCSRVERGVPVEEIPADACPLVTVDNLPRMDDEDVGVFADALVAWASCGARFLIACSPCACIPRTLLPDAHFIGAAALAVGESELPFWVRELRIPDGVRLETAAGVPLLVDACRTLGPGDPARSASFARAAGRVVERCLGEPMCASAERARWAMVLLGHGSLTDLAEVGAALRDDELAILAEAYPLFGIDFFTGTFRCVPVPCDRSSAVAASVVTGDEVLAGCCVDLLVRRGRPGRAAQICTLMSSSARLRSVARHPDELYATGNGGLAGGVVRLVGAGEDVPPSLRRGLARFVRLDALMRGVPARSVPEFAVCLTVGSAQGAVRAVQAVLEFWRGLGMLGVPAGEPDVREGAAPELRAVETAVQGLGEAGMRGDAEGWETALRRLDASGALAEGAWLVGAVLAAHAVVCGMLCGRAEAALAWVSPLAAGMRDVEADEGTVCGIPDALLGAVQALARLLVERPSATRVAAEAMGRMRAGREFCEAHGAEVVAVALRLLEAVGMLFAGEEEDVRLVVAPCQARWGGDGLVVGQYAVALALCVSSLARDEIGQAAVQAQAAEVLAQRMGAFRGVWLAHLFGSIAAVRHGAGPDVDTRLLEATLRRTAYHPGVSASLNLEIGLLYAARGDADEARDVFQGIGVFGRTGVIRLAVVCLRVLGRSRANVLGQLPGSLRAEYEGMRPFSRSRRLLDASGTHSLAPGAVLSVNALGEFKVMVGGHVVGDHEWGRRKSRKILMMLALFPERPVARDELIDLLWGGERTATVRNNLNTLLSNLRASLGQKGDGPVYIAAPGKSVGLNLEHVDVDVLRFEHLARTVLTRYQVSDSEDVLEACGRIERLFKTGFAPEFSELSERARKRVEGLTSLFVDCMVLASGVAATDGDYRVALWFARAAQRCGAARDDVREALEEAHIGLALGEVGGPADVPVALAAVPEAPAQGGAPSGERVRAVEEDLVLA